MSVLTGYSQLANGTSLDTLAQLATIPASERSDGMALIVMRDGTNGQPYWYHYKGDATPTNESPYKIAPTDNMGCWFRGVPQVLTLAVANTLYAAINHTHSEYETAGTAAASMAAHLAQADPHTQYLSQSESDAIYAAINHAHSVFNSSDNGFVPASSGNSDKFLRGDGTWQDAAGGLAFGQIANSAGTVQFSAGTVNDVLRFAAIGSASIAFDPANKLITIGATGTTYSAGTGLSLAGTTFSVAGGVLDGSSISVTAVDTTPTNLGPATLTQWFGGITNRIKAVLGSTNWWDAPATTISATATHLTNTSNPHSVTAVQVGAEPTITTLGITKGGTGLSSIAAGNILYTSGANTLTTSVITTFGRSLIDDADAATARTTLGAEPIITTLPVSKGGTGLGSIAANRLIYSPSANTFAETTLSEFIRGFLDDANATTARATLGANDAANLTAGTVAYGRLPVGAIANTIAAGDDSRFINTLAQSFAGLKTFTNGIIIPSSGSLQGFQSNIADDSVFVITPSSTTGLLFSWGVEPNSHYAIIGWRFDSSIFTKTGSWVKDVNTDTFNFSTVLTGTTGIDTHVSVSADFATAKLYIENRLGSTRLFKFLLIG